MTKRKEKSENRHNRAWMRLVRHYAHENAPYEARRNYTHEKICEHWMDRFWQGRKVSLKKDVSFHKTYAQLWDVEGDFSNDKFLEKIKEAVPLEGRQRVKTIYAHALECLDGPEFKALMRLHAHRGFDSVFKSTPSMLQIAPVDEHERVRGDQIDAFLKTLVLAPALHQTHSASAHDQRKSVYAYYRVLVQKLSTLEQSSLLYLTSAIVSLDHSILPENEKHALNEFFGSMCACDAFVHKLISPRWLPLDYKKQLRGDALIINPLGSLITTALYKTGQFNRATGESRISLQQMLLSGEASKNQAERIEANFFYKHLPALLTFMTQRINWSSSEKRQLQIASIVRKSSCVEERSVLRSVLGHYHFGGEKSTPLLQIQYQISKELLRAGFDFSKEEKRQMQEEEDSIPLPTGSFAFYQSCMEQKSLESLLPRASERPPTARL